MKPNLVVSVLAVGGRTIGTVPAKSAGVLFVIIKTAKRSNRLGTISMCDDS